MNKTDEAPRWVQKAIRIFICFGLFSSTTLRADEEKPITCRPATYPHVQCEAHGYIDQAYWTVSINGVRADYEKGIVVFLTLPDNVWAKIEVKVGGYTRAFYGRWNNKKAEFHK